MLLQCRPGLVPGEAGEVKARQLASSCGVPPCAVPKPNELPPLAQPRRAGSTQQGATKTEKLLLPAWNDATTQFPCSLDEYAYASGSTEEIGLVGQKICSA